MYYYSLADYGKMIGNHRADAYVQALKATIQPGAVVVEIGTGTGFFATLACQLGAGRVYAIEPNPMILVAQQVAQDNSCADKIKFIRAASQSITLPEPADVLLSDLRGALPLYEQHIPTIVDARQRLLKPGGAQIPQQDTLWATLIQAPDYYHKKYVSPWLNQPYGCDFSANHQYVVNTWRQARLRPDLFIVAPQIWQVLNYQTRTDPNAKATLTWAIEQPAVMHGIGTWFETILWGEIGFSAAPDQPELVYGHGFFPLSAPVELAQGDLVAVTLQANLIGGNYIYSWQTQVTDRMGQRKANFQQSTFLGQLHDPKKLKTLAEHDIPGLSEAGQIDALILDAMGKLQSLGAIAQQLVVQFPTRFPQLPQALTHVGELAQRYGVNSGQ